MKQIYVIVFLLITNICCLAQTQNEIVETVTQAVDSLKCMNCQFKQFNIMAILEDPIVSEGFMNYYSPDKMHWEYTSPNTFALVVDGENISKITDGKEEILDAKSQRVYKSVASIIMSIISGKTLFDKSIFDTDIHDADSLWTFRMKPQKNKLKRMFTMLTVYFSKNDNIISKVEITMSNGDETIIDFFDVKINESCN